MTFREALRQTLREELLADDRVILMGEDIGAYGGSYAVTKGLLEEFGPERIRDTPISESVIVGCGVGAAMGGLRPIVELMTINFSLLAFDQIVNNAAKIHYMSAGTLEGPLV
ncbi:MAG: alpha-ketoacid dehydrogenase subunit beta, partial [Chloroflexi bacterium]|nr:alpha-ketoacid dehydrogenase subunit beta [Chloroflexota bacterium]